MADSTLDEESYHVSCVLHFDAPETAWSDKDANDFIELMLTGNCKGETKSGKKRDLSTLAQSSLRKIGEQNARPIDALAQLVAKKYTCRVCGTVDFSTQTSRNSHEHSCKKREEEKLRKERNERANRLIADRYARQEGANDGH